MNEANIIAAAERFTVAVKAYREAQEQMENLELDVKLAVRAGWPAATSEVARDDYRKATWAPAYRERSEAAKALCETMGVTAADLKYSL